MSETKYCLRDDYKKYVPEGLSLYEHMTAHIDEFAHLPAVSFYGFKTSYAVLMDKIEEAERALRAIGVGRDDIVAVSLPGMPEAIHLLYAINKIGAKYCAFDCRSKEADVLETIEKFQPKLIVIPDFQIPELKDVFDCPVIHVNPTNAIWFMKPYAVLSNVYKRRTPLLRKHKNFISYSKFIKGGEGGVNLPPEKSSDDTFGYFYTSGTTYGRKSIILTNENINAAVRQYSGTEDYVKRGESILNIMPMFTCYGVTIATHLPLSLGVHVKLIPLINTKKLKKTLVREKPNFLITVPAHWEYFVKDNFKGVDLSFLTTVVVGGDVIASDYEDKINEIFKNCGSRAWIRTGYGLSETTSVGTNPIKGTPKGSVGVPMENTLVGIFNRETLEPVPAGEKGEICIYGPTVCNGYFKDEKMTDMLLREHSDGSVWLHSGDIGYMDEDGFLFFCERIKRMYVRHDGTKISPYSIEQILATCPLVYRCMITAVRDTRHTHGMCAKALIVLREGVDKKQAREMLDKFMEENLGQHMIPREVVFVERLPYTKNGKLDYFAASQMEG